MKSIWRRTAPLQVAHGKNVVGLATEDDPRVGDRVLTRRQRQSALGGVLLRRGRSGDRSAMNRRFAMCVMVLGQLAWSDVTYSQSLELQERCASNARKAFQDIEEENRAKYDPSALVQKAVSDYQSHFNTKINRCLMLVHRRTVLPLSTNLSNQARQAVLIDAN